MEDQICGPMKEMLGKALQGEFETDRILVMNVMNALAISINVALEMITNGSEKADNLAYSFAIYTRDEDPRRLICLGNDEDKKRLVRQTHRAALRIENDYVIRPNQGEE